MPVVQVMVLPIIPIIWSAVCVLILTDGTLLDTASAESRRHFVESHPEWVDGLLALRERVKQNPEMEARIRHKYELKNTCGYGVNCWSTMTIGRYPDASDD